MSLKGFLYCLEGVQAHSGRARAEPFLTMPSEVISLSLYGLAHMPTQLSSAGGYKLPTLCQALGLLQLEEWLAE